MKKPTLSPARKASRGAFRCVLALALLAPIAALHAQQREAQPRRAPTNGQGIDVYLGEDALQVLYRRNMDIGELGRNDVRGGFFINEDRDLIGIADMLINVGEAERTHPHWGLQVGPRVYGALLSAENEDIFSIALGGTLSYRLGAQRTTWVSATAYYGPDILAFGNANSVTDLALEIETPLTRQTRIYAGYRWFRFDLAAQPAVNAATRDVDEGVHVGISYTF